MDTISSISDFFSNHKYKITIGLGLLFVVFIGDNSYRRSIELRYVVKDLQDEIDKYNKIYNHDRQQLRELERDPRNIERIARERYFMKADDEDIFVLSSDPRSFNDITMNNETTE